MSDFVTKWLPWNYRPPSFTPPAALIRQPEAVSPEAPWLLLTRAGDGLTLRWPTNWTAAGGTLHVAPLHGDDGGVSLGGGTSPAALPFFSQPLQQLRLTLAGGALDGQTRLVGERHLPFETLFNVRDVGGYPTADGRRVRYGLLYRSGVVNPQSDADLARLAALGIRHVWDLRAPHEVEREPDRLPPGWQYTHTPMDNPVGRWRQVFTLLRHRRRLDQVLLRGYTAVAVDHNAPVFGAILRRLAEPEALPLLVHCAAGKDRTGIAVALLLRLLGVPEPLVVADYSLSNRYYDDIAARLAPSLAPLARLGITTDDIQPLLVADPAVMGATLRHIDQTYGSLTAYLTGPAGVPAATLDLLRHRFLET